MQESCVIFVLCRPGITKMGEIMYTDGIIFDVDGTLWDSTPIVAEAWTQAVLECGIKDRIVTAGELKQLFGKTMSVIAASLFPEASKEVQETILEKCCVYEEEALEEELNLLQHAESIAAALQAAAEAIDGEDADGSAVLLTEAAAEELSPFSDMRAEFAVLGERLAAAGIELADIASECRSLRDGMDLDPQRYAMVQKRMLEIRRLSREYQCTGDELVERRDRAEEELAQMQGDTAEIAALREQKRAYMRRKRR